MWSDRETEHDFLGYASYVNVLADTCTMEDLAPLTRQGSAVWSASHGGQDRPGPAHGTGVSVPRAVESTHRPSRRRFRSGVPQIRA